MSRKVNPNDKQYEAREGAPKCGEGNKLLACVGVERYTSSKGSRCLTARFICLLDREGRGDEKHEVFENFTLEDSSMWRFVKFVQAIGYSEEFDPDSDADIEKIVTHGYVTGQIILELWENKTRPKVERWLPPGPFQEDPEWNDWIQEGETRHAEYLEWRASNPRQARGYGGGGSGGGGSNRGGGGSGSRSSAGPSGGGYGADDIPFKVAVAA